MDLQSAGFLRQANLSESAKNTDFPENSGYSALAHPAYFAQIVDIHLAGNYSWEMVYLGIGRLGSRSDTDRETLRWSNPALSHPKLPKNKPGPRIQAS